MKHYKSRWRLRQELLELVVSKHTAPAIMKELEQGLAFVTDSELPDISDPEKRAAWNQRWQQFAREERLGTLSTPEYTCKETADTADSDSGDSDDGENLPNGSNGGRQEAGDDNC